MDSLRPCSSASVPLSRLQTRTYDLHGRRLEVTASPGSLQSATATVLQNRGISRRLHASNTDSEDVGHGSVVRRDRPWRIQVERTERVPSPPPDVQRVGESERTGIAVGLSDERLMFRTRGAAATVNLPEGRARLSLDRGFILEEPRGPTLAFTHLVGFVLMGLAQAAEWVSLHAAVLVRDGRGVLLLAESDAGKSTTAYQLVRQGWQFVSDDSVLLRETNHGIEALSMRPHFCLDAGSERHFPELGGHDWPEMVRDEIKWRVDVERLYPGRFVPSCQPQAIVMPAISDAAQSRLTPVPAQTLIPALLQQSGFRLTAGSERAGRHFQLIGTLLRQCAAYRFCGGRDVLEDGGRVRRLFERLVAH